MNNGKLRFLQAKNYYEPIWLAENEGLVQETFKGFLGGPCVSTCLEATRVTQRRKTFSPLKMFEVLKRTGDKQ